MRDRIVVGIACLLAACGGGKQADSGAAGSGSGSGAVVAVDPKDLPEGLQLRLSNGKQGAPAIDRAQLAPATKLADADTAALFATAPPLPVDPGDAQAFALRPASTPPPRAGETIKSTFPPAPGSDRPPPTTASSEPLTVVRWQPEGKVQIAPQLTVTFSEPMVAVTSQSAAAAVQPVRLVPATKGQWRWIGTRTIVFDPEIRFPQATTYQVEIPAGTKSASGKTLAQAVKFSFETPPPTLVQSFPRKTRQRGNYYGRADHPQPVDAPIFLHFDQKIDPRAMLPALHATTISKQQPSATTGDPWAGAKPVPASLSLVEAAELAQLQTKHPELANLLASLDDDQAGRWMVVRSSAPLPTSARVTIAVTAGAPSSEGPNKTTESQTFDFETYSALAIERAFCTHDPARYPCRPGMPFNFVMNNPLDAAQLDPKLVTVAPALPGMRVVARGTTIEIVGDTIARTKYVVTLGATLRDRFGQALGTDEKRTFEVGDPYPQLVGPHDLVVVDPAAKPTLDYFSTTYEQLAVKLYKVTPEHYEAFLRFAGNPTDDKGQLRTPPGAKVADTTIAIAGGPTKLNETKIELAPALGADGAGHVIAIVEPQPQTERRYRMRRIVWAQVTRLALDAYVDHEQLVAFATDLATGKPAPDVALDLRPYRTIAKTDARGLATLPLGADLLRPKYVVARRGSDVTILPGFGWSKRTPGARLSWYVADDRQMYRPGEEVSIKGWIRSVPGGKTGEPSLPRVGRVQYVVRDSREVKLGQGTTAVNALGGFDLRFTLPKTPNLGRATIDLVAGGAPDDSTYHDFQIEEFRRPEFEVTTSTAPGPFVVGDALDVSVGAKYYAGGPLPGATTEWTVASVPSTFAPPNHDEYTFGTWTPWWESRSRWTATQGPPPEPAKLSAVTDASGTHVLHVEVLSAKPAGPFRVTATAAVEDVNRQRWTSSSSFIVHSSRLYVGAKLKKPFVAQGKPIELELLGVDLDGKIVPGATLEVKAVRLEQEWKDDELVTTEHEPQTCATNATAKDAVRCAFQTPKGGRYRVTATISDGKGGSNTTTSTVWVSGGERKPSRALRREIVELVPDKQRYAPGATAELLVQAPFFPAEGVVSYRRSGIVHAERITMSGPTAVVNVPLVDAMVPNVHVQVDLVGTAPRLDDQGDPDPKLPRRPAFATGSISLAIPPVQRTLAVTVAPAAGKLAPREQTTLAIEVKDAGGAAVADAEVAVFVVDEAILALSSHDFDDPVDAFYGARPGGTNDHYLRERLALAQPTGSIVGFARLTGSGDFSSGFDDGEMAGGFGYGRSGFGPGGGGTGWGTIGTGRYGTIGHGSGTGSGYGVGGGRGGRGDGDPRVGSAEAKQQNGSPARGPARVMQGGTPTLQVRSNFNPLAAFAPAVRTGADGKATVAIAMPDNLTRYRIVALAAAKNGTHFGKGEGVVTVRLPLMVRPSAPRFLNFGDTFELPVVVQNQTDAAMTVQLGVRTSNLGLTAGGGRSVTVPPNDRVEVRFPAAAQLAGTARAQIVATAGTASDAAELAMPVWTPATTEAFATYGVLDQGAVAQPIALPGQVVTQFGGLDVTTSSTNLQALTDALLYIVHYPFDCAEQRASRILAITSLRDVLVAFQVPKLPSAAQLATSIARDLEQLGKMQDPDSGGFTFWPGLDHDDPYLTAYVTHALVRARAKGYAVPKPLLDRGRAYLREIDDHIDNDHGLHGRLSIRAFALYVRRELGERDAAEARSIVEDAGGVDKLELETAGWLLSAIARDPALATERAAILKLATTKVSETAGAAHFTTSYGDGAHLLLASAERVDAVMLEALIAEQPSHDLIPKVVTGLLGHRKRGRWLSTQENAFVLQALERYFRTYEKVTPSFVARMWLGDDVAGEAAFRGRSTKSHQLTIAMADVAARDQQALVIQKDGAGRLYYRIGMTYAPASLALAAADHGFVVERRYEAIDDPKHVTRGADGVWRIAAGARVKVVVTMVNEAERHHVALVDPIPAGLEPLNPALAITGPLPPQSDQPRRGRWWMAAWYEHQNLRDERVEAFASELAPGVHRYEYFARATTPGTFVVPPPKAEEMYMPETFGRGPTDRVIVQ